MDRATGVRYFGHHPHERPDLWRQYLDGAEGKYRHHGFEGTLQRHRLENGEGVALFIVGIAPSGEMVSGVRFHGPLEGSHKTALIGEMAASPEVEQYARVIDDSVRFGILEVKGAWSKGRDVAGQRLVHGMARAVTHSLNWLGAECAVAAISDQLLPFTKETGATRLGESWVPFPDERYRTVAVMWRRSQLDELSDPDVNRERRIDVEELLRSSGPLDVTPVDATSTQTMSWRPIILDVTNRTDRETLRVLREDSSLQFFDRYDEQHGELRALKTLPDRSILDEDHRWIYYPWRRAIVRLLAPRSFATLRLDRNRNKITRAEQARLRSLRVGVVGLSAGHSVAHLLAMEGLVGELRVADFDTIALSNLNRIPGTVLDLGVNKAVVAARRIGEIDPYLSVQVFSEGVNAENLDAFLDGLDLVIEECDSLDMKVLVRESARARRIPVVMETSDQGVLDVERFDLEPDRPIFHGLLAGIDSTVLAGLSTEEKAPFVLRILGAADVSARGAASLVEVGQTLSGWPQLAGDVTLGAVSVAAVVRRFGLGQPLASGRVRIDIDEVLEGLEDVELGPDLREQLSTPLPIDGPLESTDPIEVVVDAARRAPSGGNVQPWRFVAEGDEVRVYLRPECTSKMDIGYRGSFVAIGAALFNARVAAASMGRSGSLRLFPDAANPDHVATLKLGSSTEFEIAPLMGFVESRTTNRRIGSATPLEAHQVNMLTRGVELEGARLRLVTDRQRLADMAEVLADCDRLRFLIPEVHEQMMGELRWPGRDDLEVGLDVRTLEMGPAELAAVELLQRPDVIEHLGHWRAGKVLGARTHAAVTMSSALAAITVPRGDPISYVRGGVALERFWLDTERLGFAIQPVSPLFVFARDEQDMLDLGGPRRLSELNALAERYQALLDLDDGEAVALLVRVFTAPRPSARSVRMPLHRVLERERFRAEMVDRLTEQ